MDNQNMARILQNMIDEAEENIEGLAAAFEGYENKVNIDQRRADLAEAVKLVEELGQPAPAEQEEGPEDELTELCEIFGWYSSAAGLSVLDDARVWIKRHDARIASRLQPEAAKVVEYRWSFDRYRPNVGKMAEGARCYAPTEEAARAKVASWYTDPEDEGTWFILVDKGDPCDWMPDIDGKIKCLKCGKMVYTRISGECLDCHMKGIKR